MSPDELIVDWEAYNLRYPEQQLGIIQYAGYWLRYQALKKNNSKWSRFTFDQFIGIRMRYLNNEHLKIILDAEAMSPGLMSQIQHQAEKGIYWLKFSRIFTFVCLALAIVFVFLSLWSGQSWIMIGVTLSVAVIGWYVFAGWVMNKIEHYQVEVERITKDHQGLTDAIVALGDEMMVNGDMGMMQLLF